MLLARLVGETKRIRLGAGGMMLPNFPPLVVSEQFGLLASMAPGRIDLGVGRAPGTAMSTRRPFAVPTAQEAERYDYSSPERRFKQIGISSFTESVCSSLHNSGVA